MVGLGSREWAKSESEKRLWSTWLSSIDEDSYDTDRHRGRVGLARLKGNDGEAIVSLPSPITRKYQETTYLAHKSDLGISPILDLME
jgi:hypothetical protein